MGKSTSVALRRVGSRSTWATILVAAAVIALVGATALESAGLGGVGIGPVSFVGAVVALKLGLFAFWPEVSRRGRDASLALRDVFSGEDPVEVLREEKALYQMNKQGKRAGAMSLWDQHDPRLDLSLFTASVPTFVLSQDQRFLDWNPAFALVFGELAGIRRGAHVSRWFQHLDNFRRLPKRTDKLYGEGILPITDRERVAFLSKVYGRMVFTKIMSPIIDRGSGRIIGWTVALNINSVNKRQDYFEAMFAAIAAETRRLRYAAAYDGVFADFDGRKALVRAHLQSLGDAARVLELGSGTGQLTAALLADGRKVAAVEGDVHLLRRLKDKCAGFESRVRLVRQDPDALKGLPSERFDAVVALESLHRLKDPRSVLARLHASLKSDGILSVSFRMDGVDPLFARVKTHLEVAERFDHLKHQFSHVLEHERDQAAIGPYHVWTAAEARDLLTEAGFKVESESAGLQDGHTLLVTARK